MEPDCGYSAPSMLCKRQGRVNTKGILIGVKPLSTIKLCLTKESFFSKITDSKHWTKDVIQQISHSCSLPQEVHCKVILSLFLKDNSSLKNENIASIYLHSYCFKPYRMLSFFKERRDVLGRILGTIQSPFTVIVWKCFFSNAKGW